MFRFDYVGWRRPAYVVSVALLAGVYGLTAARGGINWGLDFVGGTSVVVKFRDAVTPAFLADLRDALGDLGRNIRTVGAAGAERQEVSIDVRGGAYVDEQTRRFLEAREAGRLASPGDLRSLFAGEPEAFVDGLVAAFSPTVGPGGETVPAPYDLAQATPSEVRAVLQGLFNEGIGGTVRARLLAALAPDAAGRPDVNVGDAVSLAGALARARAAATNPAAASPDTAAGETPVASPDLGALERAFLPAAEAVVRARDELYEGVFPSPEAAARAAEAAGDAEAARLLGTFAAAPFAFVGTETVGPAVGADLKRAAATATAFSLLGLVLYVALRFEIRFAVAGVLCTFHDVLFIVGFIGATQIEFDIPIVAAILTIAGYSINDTIVVFDRIREKMRTMRREGLEATVNAAIAETLVRSLVTGIATALAVLAFYIWGPTPTKGLNLAILAGLVVGTYSSIFVAAPLLIEWDAIARRRAAAAAR